MNSASGLGWLFKYERPAHDRHDRHNPRRRSHVLRATPERATLRDSGAVRSRLLRRRARSGRRGSSSSRRAAFPPTPFTFEGAREHARRRPRSRLDRRFRRRRVRGRAARRRRGGRRPLDGWTDRAEARRARRRAGRRPGDAGAAARHHRAVAARRHSTTQILSGDPSCRGSFIRGARICATSS